MGVLRWGWVQLGGGFRWGVQWGEGSKGANVRGIEGEQRGRGESSTESPCNLSLGFVMD